MIHTAKAVRTLQAVAMSVALALFLWSIGLPAFFQNAEAASLTNASDTLSNSAPSGSSVHTIGFTTPNGMSVGQIFTVDFPATFDLSGLNISDISMTVGGNATNTGAAAGVGTWGVATGTTFISFETPTDAPGVVASSTALVLTIGSDVGTMIVNPAATTTTYQIDIGVNQATTTIQDSGSVRVAIVDEVTVSASVDTSLSFTVSGVQAGATVNASPTSTTDASTNVTLPFGTLSIDTSKTLAQRLNISTNATNGYTVTVEQTGALQSSTGATIDSFTDGTEVTVPQAWAAPSANIADDKTFGHWGITSDDFVAGRASEFGADQWVGGSTSTPVIVMGNTGPADGTTNGVGSTTVGYQIQISSLQEAGTDYNTTLRYVATPLF